MNLQYNKIQLAILTASAVVLSSCSDIDGTLNLPVEPYTISTDAEAKNASALLAVAYPILAPVSELVSTSVADAEAAGDFDVITNGTFDTLFLPGSKIIDCTDSGTYTETRAESGDITYDFGTNQCFMAVGGTFPSGVLGGCLIALIDPRSYTSMLGDPSAVNNGVTDFKALYEGTISCSNTDVDGVFSASGTFNGYTVTGINSDAIVPNSNSKWLYDATFTLGRTPNGTATTTAISINGVIHGQKWAVGIPAGDPNPINDEKYSFTGFTVTLSDVITFDGLTVYDAAAREGDLNNPELDLSIAFTDFSFRASGTNNIEVSGGVGANCLDSNDATLNTVNFTTDTILVDDGTLVDGKRMPQSGAITVSSNGSASSIFLNPGVDVAIGANPAVNYGTWGDMTTGSSCQIFQDIIDRI